MNDNLVGHLLGALESHEADAVDAALADDAGLRAKLDLLRQALDPLAADAEPAEPPPGLALKALALVATHRVETTPAVARLTPAPAPAPREFGSPRRWMRAADWVVAACLLVAVGGIGAPMVAASWKKQQRAACADNLRRFGAALAVFADRAEGEFPRVEAAGPRGVAGTVVPLLADCGLLDDVSLCCAATNSSAPERPTVAHLEHLYHNRPREFAAVAPRLLGDYAYSLGYAAGDELRPVTQSSGDGVALMADAGRAGSNSANHGHAGQNVLFVGGHVRWCTTPAAGVGGDDIFVNHLRQVRAGVSRTDSVLGPGDARPAADR